MNDTLSASAWVLYAINAINITISFFIAYEIYIINFLLLPIFFQTTALNNFLLFLHFVLYVFLILHHRVR